MMRQQIRKVKLFFPKLRDQGLPPTVKNTIPIDEQINDFVTRTDTGGKGMRKIVDVKYSYQYILNTQYEGDFERALLIYEVEV